MNVSNNREVARALFERFLDGRQLALIDTLLTPDIIGEDDTVAVRYAMSGTLEDGDPLEEHAIAMFRFRDGRICERWAGLMR